MSDFRYPLNRRGRHALLWQGRRRQRAALTGQAGTLVRATTADADDSLGTTLTLVHSAERWVPTAWGTGLLLGNSAGSLTEYISWPLAWLPQAHSGLIRYIDKGLAAIAGGASIFSMGDAAGNNPRVYGTSSSANTTDQVQHHNGSSAVAANPAKTIASDDLVELRWTVSDDGAIQAWASIDQGAETAASKSSAAALAAAWSGLFFFVNKVSTFTPGSQVLVDLVLMTGEQSRATLLEAIA